jgi:RND family efflux transporter MFP subunit
MIIFRKITFYLALISVLAMAWQVHRLAKKEPVPPPSVAPPVKPGGTGIGAAGLVEAIHDNVNLGAPQPGLVAEVYVDVGDKVRKGQPLFRLDDRDLRAQMQTQTANLKVAEAQARRAKQQYDLLTQVKDPYGVSKSELTSREQELAVINAQAQAARASIEATQMLIDRLTVHSPIDGTVLQVNVSVGESVSQGSTAPMVLGSIDELLQVRADVDEQIATRVRPGKDAVGYIKGAPDRAIPLSFVRIEPFVVPKRSLTGGSTERIDTRVLQVVFRFPNDHDRPVYVGQQMDIYIQE